MKITLNDLNTIFQDVLENENIELTMETIANDIEEWDSLNHIYLIVAIEKQFKVKFTTQEIQSWNCVGDILNSLNKN
jgi:acyl carrier protein